MRYAYPCRTKPETDETGNHHSVTFRDIPEAITGGDSLGDALENALEALELSLAVRQEDGQEIPEPSPLEPGEELVALTPEFAMKTALLMEIRRQNMGPGSSPGARESATKSYSACSPRGQRPRWNGSTRCSKRWAEESSWRTCRRMAASTSTNRRARAR